MTDKIVLSPSACHVSVYIKENFGIMGSALHMIDTNHSQLVLG